MPELRQPKSTSHETEPQGETEEGGISRRWRSIKKGTTKASKDVVLYFRHPAFMPSFAGALLYFTVLSFSGQMVTYLLSSGYTSTHVAVARTISVAFEIMATWIAPWLMTRIGPIRSGLWFSSWQVGCLALGMSLFWSYADHAIISASALVGGAILSRVGLWGFDLSAQIIIQEVSSHQCGKTAGNTNKSCRMLKQRVEAHFLPWKQVGRAFSKYAHMCQP